METKLESWCWPLLWIHSLLIYLYLKSKCSVLNSKKLLTVFAGLQQSTKCEHQIIFSHVTAKNVVLNHTIFQIWEYFWIWIWIFFYFIFWVAAKINRKVEMWGRINKNSRSCLCIQKMLACSLAWSQVTCSSSKLSARHFFHWSIEETRWVQCLIFHQQWKKMYSKRNERNKNSTIQFLCCHFLLLVVCYFL